MFCGVHDTPVSGDVSIKTFGTPLGRWSKGNLVIGINPAGCTLSANAVINTVMNAFGLWGAAVAAVPGGVSFFTFTLAVPGGPAPDINVQFGGANLNAALSQQTGGALGIGGPSCFLDLLADVGLPARPNGVAAFEAVSHLIGDVLQGDLISHRIEAVAQLPYGLLDCSALRRRVGGRGRLDEAYCA